MPRLKSILLLFILLLFFSENGICQIRVGLSYGVFKTRVGTADYQTIPDSTQAKFEGMLSHTARISTFFKLTKFLTLRPELSYSTISFKERLDSFNINYFIPPGWVEAYNTQSEYQLQQLKLPVLLNFSFHLININKPKDENKQPITLAMDIFAGPYISFVIAHKRTSSIQWSRSSVGDTSSYYNFVKNEQHEENLPASQLNRWDFGLVAGAGLKVGLTQRIKVFIDVRSNVSSSNLNSGLWDRLTQNPSKPSETYTVNPKINLKPSLTFSLGLLFNIDFSKINFYPER